MGATLPGWTRELERSFKEVLFRFLEEVQSTKAALYLLEPGGSYTLVTQYGFRGHDLLANSHLQQDPLVNFAVKQGGAPMVCNEIRREEDLSGYVEGAGSARLLVIPLIVDGRLLGLIDARDKGRKRPFEDVDVDNGAAIAEAIVDLVKRSNLYPGLRQSTAPQPTEATAPAPQPAMRTVVETPAGETVEPARPVGLLDGRGLEFLVAAVRTGASRKGIVGVALSLTDELSGATLLYAGRLSGEIDDAALIRHQNEALQQADLVVPPPHSWRLDVRRLPNLGEAAPVRLIATEVVMSTPSCSVICSVIGAMGSPAAAECLAQIAVTAREAGDLAAQRLARRHLVRRVLEPSDGTFPELVQHSISVSRLAWQIARQLEMGRRECEEAALVGLLHDVGMRELDYDRIYRLQKPGPAERELYRRHPIVGAEIADGAGFSSFAEAVRHHHERWDGKGYPDRLAGTSIPVLSRLVHVAEVFDTLTSPQSYRRPVSAEKALETMRSNSGTVFDPAMLAALGRVAT